MPATSQAEQALALASSLGVLRVRDAIAHGIHPEVLRRLVKAGKLLKRGRGMYTPAAVDASEHFSLAQAAARVPHGMVCLLSALTTSRGLGPERSTS
ncbi:MAG: type IV toxin-antitoxin system AbiEi family antitoxin domain-containing protein [Parvibaculum sp.]|nr:type IV toxin-antitoxin system AbiEi family antitoxin domain-containing protein [Parvibaculum sp.]